MKQEDDYRWLWKDWRVIAVACVLCVALGLWVLSLSSTSTVDIHTKVVAKPSTAVKPGDAWFMLLMGGVVVMVTMTSFSSRRTTKYIVGSIATVFIAMFAWNNIKQAIEAAMQVNMNPADPMTSQVQSGLTMVLPIMLILSPIIIFIVVMKLFRGRF
jgi:hypothetical protein